MRQRSAVPIVCIHQSGRRYEESCGEEGTRSGGLAGGGGRVGRGGEESSEGGSRRGLADRGERASDERRESFDCLGGKLLDGLGRHGQRRKRDGKGEEGRKPVPPVQGELRSDCQRTRNLFTGQRFARTKTTESKQEAR
jgi:hypothetical protein